jgi:hypothetical protein
MKNLRILYIPTFIVISIFCMSFVNPGREQKIKVESGSDFNILIVSKDAMKFGVSKTKPKNSDFYTNSNFFTKNNSPIGLVVIKGKTVNSRVRGGGYFYVKNGKPYVRAKSCPGGTEFSSQSILWAIDNGVKNKRLFRTSRGKEKVYRTIIGENSNGDIMVISSNRTGLVSIEEIVDFASERGMTEGILLDGGSSVDYKLSDGINKATLQSVPSGLKSILDISEPTTYIYGNFN